MQDLRVSHHGRWLVFVTPVIPISTPVLPFLKCFIERAIAEDDVMTPEFLSGVLVSTENSDLATISEIQNLVGRWTSVLPWVEFIGTKNVPPAGPYVLDGRTISPAMRVHSDTAAAFSLPLRQNATTAGE